jgi:hypothetical protein
MTSLSGLLTTDFCGALNEEYFKDDVSVRQETLNNSAFTEFIASVDIPGCFTPFNLSNADLYIIILRSRIIEYNKSNLSVTK